MPTVKVTSRTNQTSRPSSSPPRRDSSSSSSARRDSNQSSSREGSAIRTVSKKVCFFCENAKEPTYTDSVTLRKFMNDRTRIVSHLRSGVCSKHQRHLTKAIKHARHLALLPFIPSI